MQAYHDCIAQEIVQHMLNSLLQFLQIRLLQNLPFVVYKNPDEDRVKAISQKDTALHYSLDFSEKGFVFAPFNSASPAILLKPDKVMDEFFKPETTSDAEIGGLLPQTRNARDIHIDLIKKGIEEIKNGTLKKVVLSRALQVACKKSPLELFQKLLGQYPNAFCYLWYHPKVGMWLGASPELLLSVRNGRLYTSSLAGTQVFTGEKDPVWGKKEQEEQDMVTQYIKKALENKVADLNVSDTKSVKAGNLWHLGTGISGHIKESGLSPIIKALHPTPAVCGIPRERSQEFILKNESYEREFYTGFLGEMNIKEQVDRARNTRNQENKAYRSVHSSIRLFVNLRCMKLDRETATLYVGGGITKASDPEKEWQETVEKSRTMLNVVRCEM